MLKILVYARISDFLRLVYDFLGLILLPNYHTCMLAWVKTWIKGDMAWVCMNLRVYVLKDQNSSLLSRVLNPDMTFVHFFWGPSDHFQTKCSTKKLFYYESSIFLFNFMIFGAMYWPGAGYKCILACFGDFVLRGL